MTKNPVNPKSAEPIEATKLANYIIDLRHTNFLDAISGYIDFHNLNKNLQLYTLVFAHSKLYQDNPRHALVVKKRPGSLHSGLYNLPGGKVESGEAADVAAMRELEEETGCRGLAPQLVGAIINGDMDRGSPPFLVYIYRAMLAPNSHLSYPVDQPAEWHLISEAATTGKFVPNLAAILPLLAANVIGFIIQDNLWGPLACGAATQSQHVITFLRHDVADAAGTKKKHHRFTT